MACVDLRAFPLQLLMRRQPDWRERPVAVVDADKPQGLLLHVNERARAARILPGMRYAAGLSLCRDLRAAVVAPAEIERAVAELGRRLRRYTPHVEPATDEPGVFWLDASGLERLHASLDRWGRLIRDDLERAGYRAAVAVGSDRFAVYAMARTTFGVVVFDRPEDERAAARRVPLERLALAPAVRDALDRLGVRTVGAFADLPPEGIASRFGAEVARLHRLATGRLQPPLAPTRPLPPAMERTLLDHPETNVARLVALVERSLGPLLATLTARHHALAELRVGLRFERMGDHVEKIRPATPTLDARQLLDLVRLRLGALKRLPDAVSEVVLLGLGTPASERQLQLLTERPRRDLDAANRALARVRAELGDEAVLRARLREGHLPEASFGWEPLASLETPRPREVDDRRLVRRIYVPAVPLPSRPRHEPDGWMPHGLDQGPVVRVRGPYVVSGGWWRKTVHREYHFAETQRGELLWVYYDRPRRQWFLQGRVE